MRMATQSKVRAPHAIMWVRRRRAIVQHGDGRRGASVAQQVVEGEAHREAREAALRLERREVPLDEQLRSGMGGTREYEYSGLGAELRLVCES